RLLRAPAARRRPLRRPRRPEGGAVRRRSPREEVHAGAGSATEARRRSGARGDEARAVDRARARRALATFARRELCAALRDELAESANRLVDVRVVRLA